MGKIRVKAFGDEELEQKQKEEEQARKEAKKAVKVAGMKGGERVTAVGPTEEELEKMEAAEKVEEAAKEEAKEEKKEPKKEKKDKFKADDKKQPRSGKYSDLRKLIDQKKNYPLSQALELLTKVQRGKFDETVELHVNTVSLGLSGQVVLPHGSGKKTRVAIVTDALIAEVEKGKIEFDVLVAEPSMMPKLAKVARILGPKGLMPNPKNGTISPKPEEVAKKFEGGQISFRTEGKAPLMHLIVGKMSFGDKKLEENIKTVLAAVKKTNIQKVVLKSSMSPAIRLQI
jgi:large subunit ribosomal protein L1